MRCVARRVAVAVDRWLLRAVMVGISYEECRCGGEGKAGRVEPLREVRSSVGAPGGETGAAAGGLDDHRAGADAGGSGKRRFSFSSPSGSISTPLGSPAGASQEQAGVSLEWGCCGATVTLCDSCGNLVNLSGERQNRLSFECKHCGFPVVVRSQFRSLLGLRPLSHLPYREIAETQVKLIGAPKYRQFKVLSLERIESELRATSSSLPEAAAGGPSSREATPDRKKRRGKQQSRKRQRESSDHLHKEHLGVGGGAASAKERERLSEMYVQSKWELMTLARVVASRPERRKAKDAGETARQIEDSAHFLQMLYTQNRRWPDFWDVAPESSRNAAAIFNASATLLKDVEAIGAARDRACSAREILSCMREDVEDLSKRPIPPESAEKDKQSVGTGMHRVISLVQNQSEAADAGLAAGRRRVEPLLERIRAESRKIVDACATKCGSEEALPGGTGLLFPSTAFAQLASLHSLVLSSFSHY